MFHIYKNKNTDTVISPYIFCPQKKLKIGLNSIKFSFPESWRPKSGLFPDHFDTLNRIWTKTWIPHLRVSTVLELKKWQQNYQKGLKELCCCSLKFGIIDHRSISFTTWQRPPQQGWYSDFGSNKEKKKTPGKEKKTPGKDSKSA